MPMYQYACNDCGHDFEKKLKMSQSGETQPCPTCGSTETRKRIGAFAVSGSTTTGSVTNRAPARSPFS